MKLLFFASFIFLSACVKVTDIPEASPESSQSVSEIKAPTKNTEPTAQVIALSEIAKYKVLIPIGKEVQTIIRTEIDQFSTEVALPLNLENSKLTDDQIISGKKYIYRAGFYSEGHFIELQKFVVHIPLDLKLAKAIVLTQNETWDQYERILLTGDAVITTQNFKLSIRASELIAENAIVETFPLGSKAQPTQHGKHGGKIKMEFQRAKGTMQVKLRGQAGGDGFKAADYPIDLSEVIPDKVNYGLSKLGAPGKRGGAGGNGGNSGLFFLSITGQDPQVERLLINPLVEPGNGGVGGEGGKGQPAYDKEGRTEGPKGADGPDGSPGQSEDFCESYLNKNIC